MKSIPWLFRAALALASFSAAAGEFSVQLARPLPRQELLQARLLHTLDARGLLLARSHFPSRIYAPTVHATYAAADGSARQALDFGEGKLRIQTRAADGSLLREFAVKGAFRGLADLNYFYAVSDGKLSRVSYDGTVLDAFSLCQECDPAAVTVLRGGLVGPSSTNQINVLASWNEQGEARGFYPLSRPGGQSEYVFQCRALSIAASRSASGDVARCLTSSHPSGSSQTLRVLGVTAALSIFERFALSSDGDPNLTADGGLLIAPRSNLGEAIRYNHLGQVLWRLTFPREQEVGTLLETRDGGAWKVSSIRFGYSSNSLFQRIDPQGRILGEVTTASILCDANTLEDGSIVFCLASTALRLSMAVNGEVTRQSRTLGGRVFNTLADGLRSVWVERASETTSQSTASTLLRSVHWEPLNPSTSKRELPP